MSLNTKYHSEPMSGLQDEENVTVNRGERHYHNTFMHSLIDTCTMCYGFNVIYSRKNGVNLSEKITSVQLIIRVERRASPCIIKKGPVPHSLLVYVIH